MVVIAICFISILQEKIIIPVIKTFAYQPVKLTHFAPISIFVAAL